MAAFYHRCVKNTTLTSSYHSLIRPEGLGLSAASVWLLGASNDGIIAYHEIVDHHRAA